MVQASRGQSQVLMMPGFSPSVASATAGRAPCRKCPCARKSSILCQVAPPLSLPPNASCPSSSRSVASSAAKPSLARSRSAAARSEPAPAGWPSGEGAESIGLHSLGVLPRSSGGPRGVDPSTPEASSQKWLMNPRIEIRSERLRVRRMRLPRIHTRSHE